jgi:ornithine carbamoyltransferase
MLKNLLTGEELSAEEIDSLLTLASALKKKRNAKEATDMLKGKHVALLFDKPSLRTRFSFTVAIQELGGHVVESLGETRKKEEPEDTARVIEGYCHAIMIRTACDDFLTRMSRVSKVPIINGLSDLHHPCQILADLFTLQEVFGKLEGLKLTYIGDGNNILHSLLLLAPLMGVHLHYCCPQTREPQEAILKQALLRAKSAKGSITACATPLIAAKEAHAVYTDVWTSMGFENKTDESLFEGFQVNEQLMEQALPEAVFMHCLPMLRGKEVSQKLPDAPHSIIFKQSENRLHIQKALLIKLMQGEML